MSVTERIAKILGLSNAQAIGYCAQVRHFSGVGPSLRYQVIYDQLVLRKPPYPDAKTLAKIIAALAHKQKAVLLAKNTPNNAPKSTQPSHREKINIYEQHEVIASVGDSEPYIPSHLPKDVERYSYYDHERVNSEKMEHCRHGIPAGQLCGICNAKEFRQMTGID